MASNGGLSGLFRASEFYLVDFLWFAEYFL